jgi:predicted HAD superfamily Cof-like phosphohydrolase
MRAKLILSEVSEVMDALARRDEVDLLDGLADVEYVTIGTAIKFDLPLGAAFDEVHASNMTKSAVQEQVKNHEGAKGKDHPGYRPADVAGCITSHRRGRAGVGETANA